MLHRLEVVDCSCESDLEVPVEELAAERDPGGEHLQGHEAHRLAVHQEPGDTMVSAMVVAGIELATNLREDFTIITVFTIKTLLRHKAK